MCVSEVSCYEKVLVTVQFYDGPRTEKYQTYNTVLTELNMAFTVMFTIEMILKLLAFGIRVRTRLLFFNGFTPFFCFLLPFYIIVYLCLIKQCCLTNACCSQAAQPRCTVVRPKK